MESESIPFFFRKGSAFIETGIVQKIVTRKFGPNHIRHVYFLEYAR